MDLKVQIIALMTHIHHQMVRMFRISIQVFLPSVITSLMYFLIFGTIIGKRVGDIDGVDYTLYIAPGLVLANVITNAYSNVSSSLFSARFQRSIEELLISPMRQSFFLMGYILSGIIRGVIVALLVILVSVCFVHLDFTRFPLMLLMIIIFSSFFSLAGFTNGLLAKTFDDVAIVPTFILAPLTYLGGVFYSIDMLPPFWHKIAEFNPIFYMVDSLRYAMIGRSDSSLSTALYVTVGITVLLYLFNVRLLKKGIGIRE